ncbi:MAG: porin [Phycisphaerae bacterium]|nr:porin [Phycisphaerae bacterium]
MIWAHITEDSHLKRYIVELIGTFFLVFTIARVSTSADLAMIAPLAIGGVLAAMIYALGPVSGAHFNPAVTLAMVLRKAMPAADVLPYIIFQLIGAFAAVFVAGMTIDTESIKALETSTAWIVIGEFCFTFALVLVILQVATSKAAQGNSYFGIAIGLTVAAGAWAVGPLSGAAFNPAVVLGMSALGAFGWGGLWLWLVMQFAGAIAAFLVFSVIEGCCSDTGDQ